MVMLMNSKFSVDQSNKVSLKDVIEELGAEMFEANKCPESHPVFNQLRDRLRQDQALLDSIKAEKAEEHSRSLDIN